MKKEKKSPAFQFYPTTYLGAEKVGIMTLEEEGAYIRALCYCWTNETIPSDTELLARLIGKGCSNQTAAVVKGCFVQDADSTRLRHERLDEEREKQKLWSMKSSEAGKKSGKSRKEKYLNQIHSRLNGGSDLVEPNTNSLSLSSSLSTSNKNIYISPEENLVEPKTNQPSVTGEQSPKPKKPKDPPGFRPGTRAMGPCKHVYLTQDEYDVLCKDFTKDRVHRKIISLDADIENGVPKYVKYSNHKACLLKWFAMDGGN